MLTIIIPTLNEAATIGRLLQYLQEFGGDAVQEIIVADGGSTDDTRAKATRPGVSVLACPKKGRAAQMNYGAEKATTEILYFVHADCFPPASFVADIREAMADQYQFGRYRTKFDSRSMMLKINAFFTRFNLFICAGGDQTLFMTTTIFRQLGGFTAGMLIMEDYDIVTRGRRIARYKIMQKDVLVSARKYLTNSWIRVQIANYRIVQMYKHGATQSAMLHKYRQLLHLPS